LLDHNLYDAEGRFWSARDLLRQRPVRYELVVADGFSDFTQTEHDMLQTLAGHGAETWISLPLEGDPEKGDSPHLPERPGGCFAQMGTVPFFPREDLFQKPLRTREELRRRHTGLREELLTRPADPAFPALAHLERTIFSNPRNMQPASDTAGLEILAGGRQIGEIEMIGRRIKRLLIDGESYRTHHAPRDTVRDEEHGKERKHLAERDEYVRPGQIAVVFRQLQPLADLVSEVFQRLEIPFCLENGPPLGRSPAIVMLLRLLELDAEDWPMHKLLGVLGNNYFSPDWAEWNDRSAGDAETVIRGLQIPRGRQRLLERLDVGWDQHSADPP
jgi:ATP-dependent helicase/DNAse subunit B